jgi:hypothetical protein
MVLQDPDQVGVVEPFEMGRVEGFLDAAGLSGGDQSGNLDGHLLIIPAISGSVNDPIRPAGEDPGELIAIQQTNRKQT